MLIESAPVERSLQFSKRIEPWQPLLPKLIHSCINEKKKSETKIKAWYHLETATGSPEGMMAQYLKFGLEDTDLGFKDYMENTIGERIIEYVTHKHHKP